MQELYALKILYKGKLRFLSEDPVNGGYYPIYFRHQLKIWDVHFASFLPWLESNKDSLLLNYDQNERDGDVQHFPVIYTLTQEDIKKLKFDLFKEKYDHRR